MRFNPEILSEKPTHLFDGVKVKVFNIKRESYDINGERVWTAEIMEGVNVGKWTTVFESRLKEI